MRTRDRPDTSPSQLGRSWLLIKHRDFWSGPVDITTFAPLSVKSESDFDDILAADMPDLWVTGRPSRGGATGKMLRKIIEQAAVKNVEREEQRVRPTTRGRRPAKTARARKAKTPNT